MRHNQIIYCILAIVICFGSLVNKNHTVFFSCFGHSYKDNQLVKDKNGVVVTRPYLFRYDPPKNLE